MLPNMTNNAQKGMWGRGSRRSGAGDGHEPGAAGADLPWTSIPGGALCGNAVNASYRLGMQFRQFISSLVRLGPDFLVFFSAEVGAGCLQPSNWLKAPLVGLPLLVLAVLKDMSSGFI